jgi:choline-sulfatase
MTPLRSALLAVVLGVAACAPKPPPEVAPPGTRVERVVLVTIDTLRADYVGCYGATRAHTPHMDTLAARGARFATAVSPTPLTLPSHTSLLTALDPPRHGVHHNATFRLPDDVPTLAERFHDAGWATAAFVAAVVLDHRYGLERGFDVYDDRMQYRRTTPTSGGHGERRGDQVVDAALAWLEDAPEHFFVWLHRRIRRWSASSRRCGSGRPHSTPARSPSPTPSSAASSTQ